MCFLVFQVSSKLLYRIEVRSSLDIYNRFHEMLLIAKMTPYRYMLCKTRFLTFVHYYIKTKLILPKQFVMFWSLYNISTCQYFDNKYDKKVINSYIMSDDVI